MGEMDTSSLITLALIVLVLIVIYLIITNDNRLLGGVDAASQRNFDDNKAKQLEELEGYYNTFKENDKNSEGFDSYEASFLIAKVIEYTWKDCSGFCKEAGDIPEFTNFFADHPIKLGKVLDCNPNSEYPENFPIKKADIRGLCSDSDLGISSLISSPPSKTNRADEWTVTSWILRKSLCRNYKVEGYQWGNAWCYGDSDTSEKCISFCATAGLQDWSREITSDRIKDWKGNMDEFGKTYSNIKVTYIPDCTWLKGKISYIPGGGVADFLFKLKQACSAVEIGEGTTNPAIPAYSNINANSCYYGADCPAQNPPINPPYENQCPAFFSYDGGNGATVCLYGTKCCGSEAYCAGTLSGGAAPTPGGCVQEKCWYKNSRVCTGGKTCSANGCV